MQNNKNKYKQNIMPQTKTPKCAVAMFQFENKLLNYILKASRK